MRAGWRLFVSPARRLKPCARRGVPRQTHGAISFAVAVAIALGNGFSFSEIARANPSGGDVVSGNINIQESGNRLDIFQSTDRGIINWQSFSIGANEITQFHQPSSSSLTLNRILGADPSHILGRLQANGQIMLVNPNGVIFGQNARIDVSGIVATTTDIRNEDFLNGNFDFSIPSDNPNASVVNFGQITVADTGYAALVAPSVRNEGVIVARLGRVALGATETFTLDIYGDNLITFGIGVRGTPTQSDGSPVEALIGNAGSIIADGGIVTLAARNVGAVVQSVINTDGIVQANTIDTQGGEIVLGYSGPGVTQVSGTLRAIGDDAGEAGGKVMVLGEYVGLFDNALVDASGDTGGGEILVGGNFQGKGAERNAVATYVSPDAEINANADTNGDGGRIIVWADEVTNFDGFVTASGGAEGGDGGFVEISGKESLTYRGQADLSSAHGAGGTILFDPKNITIANGGADNINTNLFAESSAADVTFDADQITALMNADVNVDLEANNDITINEAIIAAGGGANGRLNLSAGRSILINASITTNNERLRLEANSDASVGANRDVGAAVIAQADGTTLDAGTANILVLIENATGKTNRDAGDITLDILNANNILVSHQGSVGPAGGIRRVDGNSLITASETVVMKIENGGATRGTIGTLAAPIRIQAVNLAVETPGSDAFVSETNNITFDNTFNGTGIGGGGTGTHGALMNGGDLVLTAAGNILDTKIVDMGGGGLAITAGAIVQLDNASNDFGTVAVSNAGQTVTLRDTGAFTVGTVQGVVGLTGAATTLTADSGITLNNNVTATGVVSIDANFDDTNNTEGLTIAAGVTLDTTGNALTIVGDLVLDATGTLTSGAARTTISSATGLVVLGAAGGNLSITDTEIDRITAGDLVISTTVAGSDIQVAGAFSPALIDPVILNAADAITDTGAGAMTAANLRVTSGGAVDLSLGAHDVDTIAVSGGQTVAFTDTDGLTVGTVDGVVGITVAGLTLNAAAGVTVNENITATAAVVIDTDTDNNGAGDFTVAAARTVDAGNNAVTIIANDMALTGTVSSGIAKTSLLVSDGGAIDLGLGLAGFNLSTAEIDNVTAGTLQIGDVTAGAMTLSLDIAPANTNTVRLSSGGAVTAVTGGIAATNLAIEAGGTVDITDASTAVGTVAVDAAGQIVTIIDVGGIDIGTVDGIAGISATTLSLTTLGAITDSGASNVTGFTTIAAGIANDITLNEAANDFGTVIIATGNNVTLVDADDIAFNSFTIQGALTVTAAAGVTINDSIVTAGTTAIDADSDNNGTGTFTLAALRSLVAGNNDITITANKMALAGTSISSGTARTTLAASNAAAIDLGSATDVAANTVELSDAEIDIVTAGVLQIGDNASGAITVTGAITPANATTLRLESNSSVIDTATGALTVANLRLTGGGVTSLTLGAHDVDVLTYSSGGGTNGNFTDADDLTVGTVDGQSGLTGQQANLTVAGTLTIDDNIIGDRGVTITNNGIDATTNLNAAIRLTASSDRNITLITDDLEINTATGSFGTNQNSNVHTLNIQTFTANQQINLGGVANTGGNSTMELTNAELARLNLGTQSLDVINIGTLASSGTVTIAGDISNMPAIAVTIQNNADIVQTAATTIGAVTLDAATGITLADVANDFTGTLTASTNAGNITIADANALTVGATTANAGNVTLTTVAGNLTATGTITSGGAVAMTTGGGNNTLTLAAVTATAGGHTYTADDIAIGGAIDATGQTVTIASTTAGDALNLGDDGVNNIADALEISGGELALITATTLNLGDANQGNFTVDGITAANSNNVGTVALNAAGDNATITFATAASTFNALTASADDGIAVNVAVETDVGGLSLEGDADNAADTAVTGDKVTFAAGLTITAAGAMTLDATTGGIDGTGALTLNAATGITVNNSLTTAGTTIIDADSDNIGNDGDFTIATGATLSSGGNAITITANDLVLAGTGAIDAGAAAATLLVSDGGTIGLGGTAQNFTVSAAELNAITATGLTIGDATNGAITVNGIANTDVDQITGTVTLNATLDGSSVTFDTTASVFDDLTINAEAGVTVNQDLSADILTVDADSDNAGDDGVFTIAANADILTSNDAVTIVASDMAFDATGTLNSGSGRIILAPSTGTVDLGNNDAVNTAAVLELTDTELDRITTTGVLQIGSAAAIDITDPVSFTNATTVLLQSAGTITDTGVGSIAVANLRLEGGASPVLDAAANDVDTLASNSPGFNVTFVDTDDLIIGTVDGVSGVTGRSVFLTAGGAFAINDLVNSSRDVVISNNGIDATTTINARVQETGGGSRSVTIVADDLEITATGDLRRTNGNGTHTLTINTLTAGQQINFGAADVAANGVMELTNDELGRLQTGGQIFDIVNIGDAGATGRITISGDITQLATGTRTIANNADIVQTAATTMSAITFNAATGITLDNVANDFTGSITASTNTGNLTLVDANALTVGTTTANAGNVTLTTVAGNLTATGTVTAGGAVAMTAGGDNNALTLAAVTATAGAHTYTADDIAIGAAINATGQTVTIASTTAGDALNLGDDGVNNIADTLEISGAELALITATTLNLGGANQGSFTVDGITAANSNNVGTVALNATRNESTIIFSGTASTFNALTANADAGIDVDVDLTTDNGALALNGDFDDFNDAGDDTLQFGAGTITLNVAGALTLAATTGGVGASGNLILNIDDGFTLGGDLTINGATTINADADADGTGTFTVDNGVTFDTQGNALGVIAADLVITGTGALTAGAGNMTIQVTNGGTIDLGNGGGGNLNITDAELDRITASSLTIGDGTAGAIAVSSDITPGGTNTLHLHTGSTVDADAASGGGIVETNLAVTAGGAVDISDATTNIDTLAINTTTGNINVVDADALAIGAVAGVTGIDTNAGAVTLVAGDDLTIGDAGVANDIEASGNIFLQAAANSTVSIGTDVDVESTGGAISVQGDDIVINTASGSITSAGRQVTLRSAANGEAIDLGNGSAAADSDVDNILKLSTTELARITAGQLSIGHANAGAISVTQDVTSPAATLDLTTASTVDADAASGGGIVATNLGVTAGGAVDISDATTNIGTLAINTTTGNINFTDADTLTTGSVAGVNGIDTNSGAVTLTAGGDLTVNDAGVANDIGATTGITLQTATNSTLTLNANVDVETSGGTIEARADDIVINTGSGSFTNTGREVILRSVADNEAIDVGSTAASSTDDTLKLSDAEIDRVTAEILTIGHSNAGAISVTSDIAPASLSRGLHLISSTTVDADAASGGGVTSGDLGVTAGAAVDLSDSNFAVGTLAISAAGQTVNVAESGALTVGAVDGVTGITAGALTLNAADGILLAQSVTATAASSVDADFDNDGTGTLTINTSRTLSSTNTQLDIIAADLALNGTATITSGAGDMTIGRANGGSIGLGTADRDMDITDTELDQITANNLTIGGNDTLVVSVENVTNSSVTGTFAVTSGFGTGADIGVTGDSTFNAFTANANDRVNISANITTTSGDLIINPDTDGLAGNNNDRIEFVGARTLTSAGAVTLNDGGLGSDMTADNAVTLNAANGITLNAGLSTAGGAVTIDADTDNNGAGNFTAAAGETITTNSNTLSITANDITLTGSLNTGAAATTLLVSDGGSIGLGDTAGDYTLSGAELERITATGLTVGDSNSGDITVDNITAANSDNIAGTVTLNATRDNASLTFATAASTFNALSANADDRITVNVDITTDTGSLALDGDADNIGDTNDDIVFADGVTLTTANALSLAAQSGGLTALGSLTLSATNGLTFAGSLALAGSTTFNADNDANGVGAFTVNSGATISTSNNALTVIAADIDLTNGNLNSGAATTTLLATNGRTIGIGATARDFTLSGAELQNITATGLTVGDGTNGSITVNGIAAANSDNIAGTVTLDATLDNATVSFETAASTFNALTVNADDGIAVNVNVTTDTGNLTLEGDADNAADTAVTGDRITFADGVTVDAFGALTLGASTGKLVGGNGLTLNARDGVNLNDNISTTAGALVIDADSDTAETGGNADDIALAAGVTIAAGGSLTLNAANGSVTGIGGASLTALDGFTLGADLTASGATVIDADSNDDGTGTFTLNGGATISTTNNTLSITASDMVLNGTIDSGTNTTTLLVSNNGTIDLGGIGGALDLSNAELQAIAASILVIGDGTAGAITVGADVTPGSTAGADVDTLHLITGSTVTATAGGVIETNLAVTAGGAVTFGDAQQNATILAINTTAGDIAYTDADGFTVGTADNVAGVDTDAGAVTLTATTGNIAVSNTAAANDIAATTTITLAAPANDASIAIAAGADITSTGGAHSYTADDLDIAGTINATGQTVTLQSSTAGDAIDLGDAAGGGDNAANTLELAAAELDRVTASTIVVGSGTAGTIAVSTDVTPANTNTLHLETGSTVTATAGGIIETNLAIAAGGTVNVTDASTDVDVLAVSAGGQTVTFTDTDGLDIGSVDGVNGVAAATFNLNTGGGVTNTNALAVTGTATVAAGAGNDITFNNAGNDFGTVAITTGRNVTLRDANALALGTSTVSGTLTVTTAGAVTQSGAVAVTGTATLAAGAGNNITLANAANDFATITVSTGNNVSLTDTNALVLGASTVSGALNVAAGGVLTQSGALAVTGAATLASGIANDITLSNAANDFATVAISSGRNVTLADANALSLGVSAIEGTLDVTTPNGVTISDNVTTKGLTTINADSDNNGSGIFTVAATKTLATTNQALTITANKMVLTGSLNSGAADTTFLGSNNAAVDLGSGTDVAGNTIELSNAELQSISAALLQIGNGTAGAITVSADVTPGGSALHLITGSGVTATAGGIIETGLAITASGTVNFTDANTDVDTLAVSAAGQTVTFTDADSLDIGTVASVTGVAAAGVTISAAAGLAVDENIAATGAVIIDADTDNNGAGDFTVASGKSVTTASNTLSITANDLTITGTLNSGAAAATLLVSDGGSIGVGATAGAFTVSGAELQNITATGLTIGDATNDSITVNGISAANAANISGVLTLNATKAGQTVTFATGASAFGALTANADAGITLNQSVTTSGTTVLDADADNDGVGDFTIAGGTALSTGSNTLTVTANDYVLNGTLNSGTADTSLLVSDSGTLGVGDTAGDATITAVEFERITANNLTLGGAASGSITVDNLTAANTANIATTVTFDAGDNAGADVTFANNASSFRAVAARADDGVLVDANLTATVGGIGLLADTDGAADAIDAVVIGGGVVLAPGTALEISSADGLAFADDFNVTVPLLLNADNDANGVGTFTIAATKTVNTGNELLTIVAADFAIDGSLNSGTALTTLTVTNGRTVGVGATARDATVSNAELQRITANGLTIGGSDAGSITVDNVVSGVDLANINGTVTLDAGAAGAAIDFSTNDSSFKALTLNAQAGVTLNMSATTAGVTIIDADTDNNGAGDFTVAATKALITGGNALTITANDMALTGTVNSGAAVTTLLASDGGAIDLGGASGGLNLSVAELGNITSGSLIIGDATTGAITVSADVTPGGTLLHLSTGSTVTATAGGIAVANLAVSAGGAVTFSDTQQNVTNLAIKTTTGDIAYTDVDGFTVSTVDGVDGVDTDAGAVTLTAAGGNIAVSDTTAASDIAATTTVTLAAAADNASIALAAGADITSTGGAHSYTADDLDIAGTITATGQTVTLKSSTAGDAIDLGDAAGGGDNVADTLELTNTELQAITADTLVIGSGAAGAVTVSADVTPPGTTLHLTTGSTVTASAGAIVETNLSVSAGGAVTFSDAQQNVTTLAIKTTAGDIGYTDVDGFTVGTVGSVVGVDSDAGAVSLTANTGILSVSDTAAANDVEAATAIALTAAANEALITIAGGAGIESAGGAITLTADDIDIAGTITNATRTVTLAPETVNDADAIDLGSDTARANVFEVTNTDLDRITAGTIVVGSGASGALVVSTDVTPAVADTLHLASGSTITAVAGGVIETNLAVSAGGAVTFSDAQQDVTTLAIKTTAGDIAYTDADGFTVSAVDGVDGVDTDAGAVSLAATTGSITVLNTAAVDDIAATTTIALTAAANDGLILIFAGADIESVGGAHSYTADDLSIAGTVTAAGQTVTLKSATAGDAIDLGDAAGGGDNAVDTLELTNAELQAVTADTLVVGSGAAGAVTVTADVAPGGNTLHVLSGSAVTATAGAIVETNLAVTAAGAVTFSDPQQNAATLAIKTTTGDIAYTDVDGFTVGTVDGVTGVDTDAGAVALTATTGNIDVSNTAAANDIAATTTVTLAAAANDASIAIATGADVASTGGAHSYTADDLNIAGTITATGQTVTLKSATAGDAIDLGDAAGGGDNVVDTLELTDTELQAVTADTLEIGSGTAGAVTVSADVTPGATTLHVTSGSTVTATAGGIVETNLAISAGGAVNVTDATTNVDTLAVSAAGQTVTFTDLNGIDIGTVDSVLGVTAGSFSLNSGGAVTDTSALAVTGVTTVTAGAGNDVTFDIAVNDFGTVAIASGRNVILHDANTLALGTSTVSGTLNLTAAGPVTQSGALDVTGTTTLAAGSGNDITLNNAGNDFATVAVTTGRNVSVRDANALALGASTVSGTLDVTAAGPVTQSGALDVTGTTTVTAGAGNDVTLDNAGNDFAAIAVASGRDVALRDANAILLGASTVAGTLDVTAANGVTINDNVGTNGATVIDADSDNNGSGTFTVAATRTLATTGNPLTVTANKMVLGGTLNSGAAGTTLTASNGAAIDLGSATDAAGNTVELSNAELQSISAGLLQIGSGAAGAITVSADVTPAGTALHLVTGAGVTATAGGIIETELAITASGSINVTDASTDVDTLAIDAPGRNATFTDADGIDIGTVGSVTGVRAGAFNLTTAGIITDSAATRVTGATVLDAGATINAITLDVAGNNFGSVAVARAGNTTLVDINAITLGVSNISGTLDVTGTAVNTGTSVNAGATTLNGAASGSGLTVTSLTLNGSSANLLNTTVGGLTGPAAATATAMPDASSHRVNGCLKSFCPAPSPPPGSSGVDGGQLDTIRAETETIENRPGPGNARLLIEEPRFASFAPIAGEGEIAQQEESGVLPVVRGDDLLIAAIETAGNGPSLESVEGNVVEASRANEVSSRFDDSKFDIKEFDVGEILERYESIAAVSIPKDAFEGQSAIVIPELLYYQRARRGSIERVAPDAIGAFAPNFSRFQAEGF